MDPFPKYEYITLAERGVTTVGAIDTRHREQFRYYESDCFEHYLVSFFEKCERSTEVSPCRRERL